MTTLGASYEGQTDGTAYTVANSDDNGDAVASSIALNSGTIVYSTAQAQWGSAGVLLTRSGTNSIYYAHDLGAPATSGKFRTWIYLPSSPSATADFPVRFVSSSDGTLFTIQMTTGRVLRISAGTSAQGTVGLSLSTWYRLEVQWSNITSGSGTIDVQAYAGNGTTATDTVSLGSLALASGPQRVRRGMLSTGAPSTVRFDDHPTGFLSDDDATPFGAVNPDTDAASTAAAVGAAANNASVAVSPNADSAAALAEALFDTAGGSVSINMVAQDAVRVTAAANDASVATLVVGPGSTADAAAAAGDATTGVAPTSTVAAAAAAANDAGGVMVAPQVLEAPVAAAAGDAAGSVGAASAAATAGAAAGDATVTVTGAPISSEAPVAAAAGDATASVAASALVAGVTAAANDAVVSTTGLANAAADVAGVGAAAGDASVSTSQPGPSTVADVAAAAGDAAVVTSVAALAESADVATAAGDAAVSTVGQAFAVSTVAAAAGAAGDATAGVAASAGAADVLAAAGDVLAATASSALAEVALVFGDAGAATAATVAVAEPVSVHAPVQVFADDSSVDIMVSAISAEVGVVASDAGVYGPPAPGALRARSRPAPRIRRRPREQVGA
jgi:hypothetical protein